MSGGGRHPGLTQPGGDYTELPAHIIGALNSEIMNIGFSFDNLAVLEPRLAGLEAEATQAVLDGLAWCFARRVVWRARWVVGPDRKRGGDDPAVEAVPRSEAALDVVIARLDNILGITPASGG